MCFPQPSSDACQIWGVRVMQGKLKEQWTQLCEQAAIEQDSEQLRLLMNDINRMLYEKDQRLKRGQPEKASFDR
jgi:hypothetical protein